MEEIRRTFRVEVTLDGDENSRKLVEAAHQSGLGTVAACHMSRLYFIYGQVTQQQVTLLCQELLSDPVTERFALTELGADADSLGAGSFDGQGMNAIEVTLLPGVTDPAAENLVRAARLIEMSGVERAATGQRYLITGDLDAHQLRQLAEDVLANPVVQRYGIDKQLLPPFFTFKEVDATVEVIAVREAGDEALLTLSRERRLALDLAEMKAIQAAFEAEGRDPTDAELEMLAQTWSEHCVHKTFRAAIDYTGPDGNKETIEGLLNTYIRGATEKINKPWVRSAFVDNAGIIAFDDQLDLAFKVETHNHPSALEPFGGANTGVGGVVRDVLGVSARPIANTDILCFGPPNAEQGDLPAGVLHPRRVADGVVAGIEDYGNKMGIPTVNGAIVYHQGYAANPLVYCGCLGVLPRDSHPTEVQPGDLIVSIGGRTGRDGLRGATFSSMEMDTSTSEIAGTAVQIGHPIQEKQVQEVVLRARDERLYSAITDCGAGGFSSAVGEMGEHVGARVQLQDVPLKYPGLRPWEIWLSEAQERMVLAVPPAHFPRLQEICKGQDVEATVLGEFEPSGRLRLYYGDKLVADVSMWLLHDGIPTRHLQAVWQDPRPSEKPKGLKQSRLAPELALLRLLAHPNIRSKEDVVRQYDHEVQGGTAVKPLTGSENLGPGDGAVLVPLETMGYPADGQAIKGAALSNGICPSYGELDPYLMSWAAVDEAMRNAVAVGADPEQVAILDNFCWGNPMLPDRLGSLVRCVQGCHDAALAYETPFVSGKDSLNNEYTGADGRKHAIPGTLLISAVGIVPDVNKSVTMDLKQPGNFLFMIGETRAELGGSHFGMVGGQGTEGNLTPPAAVERPLERFKRLHQAMQQGLIQACHDCSEGGIGVALAEMCIGGNVGARVQLMHAPRDWHAAYATDEVILFSESLSRFVVEVTPDDVPALEAIMGDQPHACFGIIGGDSLRIAGKAAEVLLDIQVAKLARAWRGHLQTADSAVLPPLAVNVTRRIAVPQLAKRPNVLILHANGTNRDGDAALACRLAGGKPEIVHINQLLSGERRMQDYHMLVIPGGFSYGDDLGAGALWAFTLRQQLGEEIREFVADGRPVLGICNGFQVLVKAGVLNGSNRRLRPVTLTYNRSEQFECRWVTLQPDAKSPSIFTKGLTEPIVCPVAHGEGRLAVRDDTVLSELQAGNLIPLTYAGAGPSGEYPANPNGSAANIAALCNPAGNVLGVMPHPENHIFPWQHPLRHRGSKGGSGLRLFENGVRNA